MACYSEQLGSLKCNRKVKISMALDSTPTPASKFDFASFEKNFFSREQQKKASTSVFFKSDLRNLDYSVDFNTFIDSFIVEIFEKYILISSTVNKLVFHQELLQTSKELLHLARDSEIDGISNYYRRISLVIADSNLDDRAAREVWRAANICANKVKYTLYGPCSVSDTLFESENLENGLESALQHMTWQEHFKVNLPPKYQGVKKDGKALPFFLKWYRGRNSDMTPHENGRRDYVDLGMTQADVRRFDAKVLRAVASAATYSGDFQLDEIIPPAFRKDPDKFI